MSNQFAFILEGGEDPSQAANLSKEEQAILLALYILTGGGFHLKDEGGRIVEVATAHQAAIRRLVNSLSWDELLQLATRVRSTKYRELGTTPPTNNQDGGSAKVGETPPKVDKKTSPLN